MSPISGATSSPSTTPATVAGSDSASCGEQGVSVNSREASSSVGVHAGLFRQEQDRSCTPGLVWGLWAVQNWPGSNPNVGI